MTAWIDNVPRPTFNEKDLRTVHSERTDGEKWGAVFSWFDHDLDYREAGALAGQPVYRFALWRMWNDRAPRFIVIGLNPSTATQDTNDPTIRRCLDFARREQCGALVMLNLFALRSTEAAVLKTDADPIGEIDNDKVLDAFLRHRTFWKPVVVCAWGTLGTLGDRDSRVREIITAAGVEPLCFGENQDGTPKHPLYLAKNTPLRLYTGRSPVKVT